MILLLSARFCLCSALYKDCATYSTAVILCTQRIQQAPHKKLSPPTLSESAVYSLVFNGYSICCCTEQQQEEYSSIVLCTQRMIYCTVLCCTGLCVSVHSSLTVHTTVTHSSRRVSTQYDSTYSTCSILYSHIQGTVYTVYQYILNSIYCTVYSVLCTL